MDDDNYNLLKHYDSYQKECGDETGDYNQCYDYGNCEGVTSEYWNDCYKRDIGCQFYNGCTNYYCINTIDPTFFEFAECYEKTSLYEYECTDQANYEELYMCVDYNYCEEIGVSEFWYDCFHDDEGCEDFNGCDNYECIENEVTFFEWLEC